MTETVRIPAGNLQQFCSKVLTKVGVPKRAAESSSLVLVRSDLRGIPSHGVSRLGVYLKRLASGAMDARGAVRSVTRSPGMHLLDAGNALGQYAAFEGMCLCLETAAQNGAGVVGMRNTNHIGMASYFSMMAADQGMIGITMNNASPHVAPWGGKEPMLGTNPLSIAIPTGGDYPIVLDMATTLVSRGKIILAAKENREIPMGWAFDREGRQTTDAQAALLGSLMPVGGYKGYGLALCIDIISALMTGSTFGPDVAPMAPEGAKALDQGVLLQAIDISGFMPMEKFQRRIKYLTDRIKGSALAQGAEKIFLPGEIEYGKEQDAWANGVPLERQTVEELEEISALHRVILELDSTLAPISSPTLSSEPKTSVPTDTSERKLLAQCASNLEHHGFTAKIFDNIEAAKNWIEEVIVDCKTIGVGGSYTIREMGLMELFQEMDKEVYDHWQPDLTPEADREIRLQQGRCDCFFASANAIALSGEIVNTDGCGNRTNALTFGPEKIVIIAGRNKITADLATALERVRQVAAPRRAASLGWDLPCAKNGKCTDCNSPQRICRVTNILHRQPFHSDISVALIDQDLGY